MLLFRCLCVVRLCCADSSYNAVNSSTSVKPEPSNGSSLSSEVVVVSDEEGSSEEEEGELSDTAYSSVDSDED